jgi:hypothetical protein
MTFFFNQNGVLTARDVFQNQFVSEDRPATSAEIAALTALSPGNQNALAVAPGIRNIQQVMASPPTVAISTTNPIPSGQFYSATNQFTASLTAPFNVANWSLTRSGNPGILNTTFPFFKFMNFNTIASVGGSNVVCLSVIFSGTVLVMQLGDLNTSILVKVNDQYTSLTPVATGATGGNTFLTITFGSAVTGARIDILSSNVLGSFRFSGMFTGSLTDTLEPAPIRGPRVLVLGDSVTSATGATHQALGFVGVFSEYMGWDDVWPLGIGATGMLTSPTSKQYFARLSTDIIPFNPDEVIVAGFQNDNGQTFAAMFAAASQIITTIQAALPACRITFFGPYTPSGAGTSFGTSTGVGYVATRAALNAAVAAANSSLVRLIDPSQYNLPNAPFSTTLTAAAASNATSITTAQPLIPGVHYQFADGLKFRCLSTGGTVTAAVDLINHAQANGATVTQTGNYWITGSGKLGATTGVGNADLFIIADGIHPTNLGHLTLGIALATQYVQL